VPGYSSSFGTACTGSSERPEHTATGTPELGQSVVYRLADVPALRPAVLCFGTSSTSWNGVSLPFSMTPLGAPGCYLRTNCAISIPLSTGFCGGTSVSVRIPVDPQLIGDTLYSQRLVVDPAANQLGVTSTQGVATHLGGRP
jgi:hypothetical protein